jgi:membrane-bound lytic murein transglycosylase A
MDRTLTFLLLFTLLVMACQNDDNRASEDRATQALLEDTVQQERAKVPLWRNGKRKKASRLPEIYTPSSLDSLDIPPIDVNVLRSLEANEKLLQIKKRRRHYQIGNLLVQPEDLEATIDILQSFQYTKPFDLGNYLEAYQIWGKDQRGHVQFTGYYTPVLKVSRTREGPFQYPIYSRPLNWEGAMPSRAEIEGEGVLDGQGLELAYADNKVDIYYMQVQGSGYVEYPDGTKELFAYNGNNRYPYRSIEKYIINREDLSLTDLSIKGIKRYLHTHPELVDTILFQNPSYTFFTRKKSLPKGAGNVPLIDGYSIAVDRRYIPLGACLIAAFPVFDQKKQRVIRHDYRFLVAHDVGGAIRGPGHIDVYSGVGESAAIKAGNLNSYGQLWLLLPRPPNARFISQ